MAELETDYLVVGAGASGMGFTDALIADSDADVVMVDRRHRPGGHWNDDYPFVRLHQPSAYYGVNSRPLGTDRIDETGPNVGFYERATAAEICDYYSRVLDEHFIPSGRVRFLGMCDYLGDIPEGQRIASRLTGETSIVRVRRKLVDATALESSLPSTHTPSFIVDPGVRFVTPNDLIELTDPGSGYTVIGAGKTSMDTCCWLVDNGVAPEAIRWIRPRDAWTIDRAWMQPLKLMGSIIEWLALEMEAAAEAEDLPDLVRRLEKSGVIMRLDPDVEPEVFRGAILSEAERATLRRIENVVRLGRVRRIGSDRIELEEGSIPTGVRQVHVDCSASGLGMPPARPIFELGRITMQRVQFGIDPFSAALIGYVEATRDDDDEKNRLCPPNPTTGGAIDLAKSFLINQRARVAWLTEPDLREWLIETRLSPFRSLAEQGDDPHVQSALMRMIQNTGPAIQNLEQLLSMTASPAPG